MRGHPQTTDCPPGTRGWWRAAVVGFAAGVVCAGGVAALAAGIPAAKPDSAQARVESFEARELPREWRWTRKAITFDDMFPQLRRAH